MSKPFTTAFHLNIQNTEDEIHISIAGFENEQIMQHIIDNRETLVKGVHAALTEILNAQSSSIYSIDSDDMVMQ